MRIKKHFFIISILCNIIFITIIIHHFSNLKKNKNSKIIYVSNSDCMEDKDYLRNYDYYSRFKGENKKSLVLRIGDPLAYGYLLTDYFKSDCFYQILPYAIIMANKWQHPRAMYNVYEALIELYTGNSEIQKIYLLDKDSRDMAIHYLIKSFENEPDTIRKNEIFIEELDFLIQNDFIKMINGHYVIAN